MFVELPAFERHRADYLDDGQFLALQQVLMANPEAGDVIPTTGGPQFWLFTLYDKDQMDDLKPAEKAALRDRLKAELKARKAP